METVLDAREAAIARVRALQPHRGLISQRAILEALDEPGAAVERKRAALRAQLEALDGPPAKPAPKFSIGEYSDQPSKPGPREWWVIQEIDPLYWGRKLVECDEDMPGAFKVREVL